MWLCNSLPCSNYGWNEVDGEGRRRGRWLDIDEASIRNPIKEYIIHNLSDTSIKGVLTLRPVAIREIPSSSSTLGFALGDIKASEKEYKWNF